MKRWKQEVVDVDAKVQMNGGICRENAALGARGERQRTLETQVLRSKKK